MGKKIGPDDTIMIRRRAGPRVSPWLGVVIGIGLGAAAAGAWFAFRTPPPPAGLPSATIEQSAVPGAGPSPPASSVPQAVTSQQAAPPLQAPTPQVMAPPEAAPLQLAMASPQVKPPPTPLRPPLPPLATEAEILARAPSATETYRFAPQPEIVVLQFATLAEQAAMLNRVAAMLERAGFPRDRVLETAELDRRIRATGSTPDTLYFGHDYRASDLVRFFAETERAGAELTAQERWLRDAVRGWGWQPATTGALISLVREDLVAGIDRASRATILRHELSHGQYFTNADYAAYARRFWDGALSEPERRRFRAFLGSEGYDTAQDDLMVNETQAYLMHTLDGRFFTAAAVGLTPARLDGLRALFLTGMPASWLRDCTVLPAGLPTGLPARAPRRRQRLGAVRIGRMKADTRAPPRTAWSRAARSSRT